MSHGGRAARVALPMAIRLRRPTIVLGSTVALLGVALTATSFTWREHVTVLRSNGRELATLSPVDYPGARALVDHVRVRELPMRPTALEAKPPGELLVWAWSTCTVRLD